MVRLRHLLVVGLVALVPLLFTAAPAWPQDDDRGGADPVGPPAEPLDDEPVIRAGTITIGSDEVSYTSRTGRMEMTTEQGRPRASIFYVAYTRNGVDDVANRPITFTFNGGPGSSAIWLHMGAFGPQRVDLGPEGFGGEPPFALTANGASLLDVTDLVFIDPVSTGYSRPADGEKADQFHGLEQDIASVGEFIHRYMARHSRWSSPRYLAGESYGTTRASGPVDHMQQRYGMYFNGIILVSAVLDFSTLRFNEGNDLPFPLFLPTYTATAHFHGALNEDLQKRDLVSLLDEVEEFATTDYTIALARGDRLPAAEHDAIAAKLAAYTGTSVAFIENVNLRPSIWRFTKELRRADGLTVGRLDSRYTGHDRDRAGDSPDYDPSMSAILGSYGGTFNSYVRDTLGYKTELPYEILNGLRWDYGRFENRYVNVAPRLRNAMVKNPKLQVFIANGYHDLATPYFATEYTFAHLGLPESLRGNVRMSYFEAGHMMYVRERCLRRLKKDIAAFIADSDGR